MIESGQQFGLYVVKDVFEADEFQACCCAEDPFFNREVTLKIFSTDQFSDESKLGQLEALIERLAVLDHPSIAPIYDSGLEENSFYYTSACYPGETLAQLASTPLVANEALKILYDLTEALDYAYQQEFSQGLLSADKVYFDVDGRAVLFDFGIDHAITQITTGNSADDLETSAATIAETMQSIGILLLQMLLGQAYDAEEQIEVLCENIDDAKMQHLVGRFLLAEEGCFASFAELLEELAGYDEVEGQSQATANVPPPSFNTDRLNEKEPAALDAETEKMVADVRQLVAEKNSLQEALDNALLERTQADNKLADGLRQVAEVRQEVAKAKEEANVAWELVAGQKYDRWRPVAWAVGGFLIGFVLSGSYGYYYSEQTRNELLARLQANEELIKTATWRPAEQKSEVKVEAPKPTTLVAETEVKEDGSLPLAPVLPVKEEALQWWPAGSEFSTAAAIPIEKIRLALGLEGRDEQTDLSELLREEVITTVRRWAGAWSKKDLSGYFSAYSQVYRPELGRSLEEWRDIRRLRLTRPQWIQLTVDDIRIRKVGEGRVQVKLKQSYRSDFYQDQILKSINLIKEDGEWRILMERSLGMIGPPDDIVGG